MKVLTASEMGEVDRRTIALGIPGLVLMENAGHRVVEFLAERFQPLASHRIVVFCGKGNNGGDGFVAARQLFTRFRPKALHVVLTAPAEDLKGDAAANYHMLLACGCRVERSITPPMRLATVVLDALLGTGLSGPAKGPVVDFIREINTGFPLAKIVAVDIPSGLPSDAPDCNGASVRADYTVTFTAPKAGQVLPPNCDRTGELIVGAIGSPPSLFDGVKLALSERADFGPLFAPRARGAHKGNFGHVLVVGGSTGKTGAAAMAGLSALRAGAGLVTVASSAGAIRSIAAHAPELMTEVLAPDALERKDVLAVGPGLGTEPEMAEVVRALFADSEKPMVVDADALTCLAGSDFRGLGPLRVLTPHPGEMARLLGGEKPADRLGAAREFAAAREVVLVLKGQRTLVAFPDGNAWVNPTGTPAMATGGSGDILTGLIAGFLAQFPNEPNLAVRAAVYLHGRAGELAAAELGEQSVIATDLLRFLPEAMDECRPDSL